MTSIERVNELIKEKHANWIGISNQVAIKEVLDELEGAKREVKQYEKALHDQIIKDYDMELDLKQKLEKKDKIINLMAEYMAGGNYYTYATKEGIIEDFEKKVGE